MPSWRIVVRWVVPVVSGEDRQHGGQQRACIRRDVAMVDQRGVRHPRVEGLTHLETLNEERQVAKRRDARR